MLGCGGVLSVLNPRHRRALTRPALGGVCGVIDIQHRLECGVGVQLKEGRIDPGSPLWAQLSPADQQKRQTAVAEAGVKLKSPNFVVSPTRVRLLNVPLTWDSKQLKACCQKAVVTRATQAKPKITQVRRSTAQHSVLAFSYGSVCAAQHSIAQRAGLQPRQQALGCASAWFAAVLRACGSKRAQGHATACRCDLINSAAGMRLTAP